MSRKEKYIEQKYNSEMRSCRMFENNGVKSNYSVL